MTEKLTSEKLITLMAESLGGKLDDAEVVSQFLEWDAKHSFIRFCVYKHSHGDMSDRIFNEMILWVAAVLAIYSDGAKQP